MPGQQVYDHSNSSQNSMASSLNAYSPDIQAALLDGNIDKQESSIHKDQSVSFAQKLLNLMNFHGNSDQKGEKGSLISNLTRHLSLAPRKNTKESIYPDLSNVNPSNECTDSDKSDSTQQKNPGPRRVVLIHERPVPETQEVDINDEDIGTSTSVISGTNNDDISIQERDGQLNSAIHIRHRIPLLDHFDADNEESFTLESFDQLIQTAASSNKYFILAKVITADPNDESRHYQSYYDAQQINKVLFRTQPEQSLLHRMRAKNPLNNMPIIGDVVYYIISPASVQKSEKRYKKRLFQVTLKSLLETLRKEQAHLPLDGEEALEQMKTAKIDEKLLQKYLKMDVNKLSPEYFFQLHCMLNSGNPVSNDIIPISKSDTMLAQTSDQYYTNTKPEFQSNLHEKSAISPSASPPPKGAEYEKQDQSLLIQSQLDKAIQNQRTSVSSVESLLSTYSSSTSIAVSPSNIDLKVINEAKEEYGKDAIYYKAHYYGTDDDFLMKGTVREFFKENAINPEDPILFTLYRNEPSSRPGGTNDQGVQLNVAPGSALAGINTTISPARTAESNCANACCGFLRGKSRRFRIIFSVSVALAYLTIAVLVLMFAIPDAIRVLVGISFLCIFALITLLLADVNRYYSQQDAIASRQTRPPAVTATVQTDSSPSTSPNIIPPV